MMKTVKMSVIGVAAVVAAALVGGCQSMKKNGMLSPRSGELFQTTRMGPGKTTESCCMVTVWGLFAASEGHSFGYLVALAGLPSMKTASQCRM